MGVKYAPVVQLDKGLVRGIVQPVDDSEIYLYQGFRYGRANRFEKAQPVEPWTGVYDAITVRDNSPQLGLEIPHKGYFSHTYSEDCLLLNVWKPIRETNTARAVMVYIFGGGFKTGSIFKITHDARWIAHRGDVIVVTVNYRLGPFGFLFGDDREAPANLGMHDQILALHWVQENIAKFGGDPNSVTIFGNSAGSVAVGVLILSPLTKGLFHRAIIQSGHPNALKHKNDSLEKVKSIAAHLNCDSPNMSEVIKSLKTKSVDKLLNAAKDLNTKFDVVYGDELLPVRPVEALLSGKFNSNIDLMYGTVRDEGSAFVGFDFPEFDKEDFKHTIDTTREYISKVVGEPHGNGAADFYMSISGLSDTSSEDELRQLVFQASGDLKLTVGVVLFGEHHAKHSTAQGNRVYAWQLTQPAEIHVVSVTTPKFVGVCHADELFYLFTITRQRKPEDIKLSHQLIKAWAQFAKYGDPGSVGNQRWTPAVESGDFTTRIMALGYDSKMVNGFHKETCHHFWKDKLFV